MMSDTGADTPRMNITVSSAQVSSVAARASWSMTPAHRRGCDGLTIVDRLTFGGTIIETGTDSYRLAHTRNQTASA
jgi:hypothetical protein